MLLYQTGYRCIGCDCDSSKCQNKVSFVPFEVPAVSTSDGRTNDVDVHGEEERFQNDECEINKQIDVEEILDGNASIDMLGGENLLHLL